MQTKVQAAINTFSISSLISICPVTQELYGYATPVFDEQKFAKAWSQFTQRGTYNQRREWDNCWHEALELARERAEAYVAKVA